ncbi:MAG: methyltransferase domain-containing protein [Kiloniellales bacterium]|nr:methyltransferase domain-containing protein [Kiloniellales bacterium]
MSEDETVGLWNRKAEEWHRQVGHDGDDNRRVNSDPVLWRFLGEVAGLNVLDAGCGTGYLSRQLATRGARVLGVDAAARMIAVARRESDPALKIDFRVESCAELPSIADACLDRIVSNYVLMDLPELDAALRAFHRVLRPGGAAVLVFSHPCFPLPDATAQGLAPQATFVWRDSYFEERRVTEPPWNHFSSEFVWFHRPLSRYWQAFRKAGFRIEDFDEPAPADDATADLSPERLAQLRLHPFSVAFHLVK